MGKLVEGRPGLLEMTQGRTIEIDDRFIDKYNHVNHAGYIALFHEERMRIGIESRDHVAQLSITYPEQFKEGDTATVAVNSFINTHGEKIAMSEMRKPDNKKRPVQEAVQLVSTFTDLDLPTLVYNPRDIFPKVFARMGELTLPETNSEYLPHTVYAPIFENERIKAIEAAGLTMEEIMDTFGVMMFIFQLDAQYKNALKAGTPATVDSRAHLQAGNSVMIYHQVLLDSHGTSTVTQQIKSMFVNKDGAKTTIPEELLEKFRNVLP